ncbi:MAG: hypothetical protein DCC49_07730 [Acidobacteria bacterium]|nr:MAG: hypothetical protein DCC49_07730 [Acidobacteriota bacterium]
MEWKPAAPMLASFGIFTSAAAAFVARKGVSVREESCFRSLNSWPESLRIPLGALMQAGNFGSVWIAAGLAREVRRPVAVAGTVAWVGCKLIKPAVKRGRPAYELDDVRIRGRAQSGLGFPSGHAAVAFSLATVISPGLPRTLRPLPYLLAVSVALARVYVGAHLPADIIGGAGVGIAAGALARGSGPPTPHGAGE